MKLLALFAPAAVMSSYIFDRTSGETITQICGENGNNDYNCLCNKMPDTFYAEMLNCTRSCGVLDDFDNANNAQTSSCTTVNWKLKPPLVQLQLLAVPLLGPEYRSPAPRV
ncbi:hypothetical protein Cantr_01313 [Candida viswanathii]|uniref:Extracellular membrane protein CFEM domain-containing protein n=1 Tax=Candida viswanathii TaxID=5486 RepID=A0A367YID9_9ASCO|nr:hypothetical protein Cantr_01313 [Candida viswanathii]